jgi:uncharacterized protein YcbK (DUF882 family)
MILITPHFRLDEFACKDGTPYPREWIESRLQPLADMLEKIREKVGHPITIVCGYRSPEYNEKLRQRGLQGERGQTGVAKNSQHTEGNAADISCFGMTTDNLFSAIKVIWEDGEIPALGGIGRYTAHGFVHVDTMIKAPGKLRTW